MNYSIIPGLKQIKNNGEQYRFDGYSPAMSLQACCQTEEILSDFAMELKGERPIKAELDETFGKEEYFIEIFEDTVFIKGGSNTAVHYAFCSLIQLSVLNGGMIPSGTVYDKPDMSVRGVSDDISRGQISSVDGFKSMIRRFSYFKYNLYMPYIEDTFKFAFSPDFGKYSDPVPASEWKEICSYSEGFGVSVRPIINLIGHWNKNRRLYDFRDFVMYDNGRPTDILDFTKKDVREFVSEMLDEIVDAFGKGVIHIGGDEAADVKRIFGEEKGAALYAEYCNWLNAELKKRECTMMMYSDMFFPVYGDYSFGEKYVDLLDKDITLLGWDYAPRNEYSSINGLSESGYKYGISSGSWVWNRFVPQLEVSYINSKNIVKQVAGKCDMFVISSWNDGGTALREEMIPSVAAGSVFAWNNKDARSFDDFINDFYKIYYGYDNEVTDVVKKIYSYDKPFKTEDIHEYAAIGCFLASEFWKDARQPTSEKYNLAEVCSELISEIGEAEDLLKENKPLRFKQTYDAFMFDVRRLMWTFMRACVVPSVPFESREEARSIVDDLTALSEEFELIKKENKRLWNRQNRPSEWNCLESKYIDTEQSIYSFIRNCKFR